MRPENLENLRRKVKMKKLNIAKKVKGSNFDPIVEMAKLVKKGGALQNKDVENVMQKRYGSGLFVDIPVDVSGILDALEEDNYHNEYALLQALKNKDKDAIKPLVFIMEDHIKRGSMDYSLQQIRDYFGDRDWYLNLLQEQKTNIKNTPLVKKVMKFMSKSDRDRITPFLEGN
jgi:hypothetical protein